MLCEVVYLQVVTIVPYLYHEEFLLKQNLSLAGTSGIGKAMFQFIDWFKNCNFGKR